MPVAQNKRRINDRTSMISSCGQLCRHCRGLMMPIEYDWRSHVKQRKRGKGDRCIFTTCCRCIAAADICASTRAAPGTARHAERRLCCLAARIAPAFIFASPRRENPSIAIQIALTTSVATRTCVRWLGPVRSSQLRNRNSSGCTRRDLISANPPGSLAARSSSRRVELGVTKRLRWRTGPVRGWVDLIASKASPALNRGAPS